MAKRAGILATAVVATAEEAEETSTLNHSNRGRLGRGTNILRPMPQSREFY